MVCDVDKADICKGFDHFTSQRFHHRVIRPQLVDGVKGRKVTGKVKGTKVNCRNGVLMVVGTHDVCCMVCRWNRMWLKG